VRMFQVGRRGFVRCKPPLAGTFPSNGCTWLFGGIYDVQHPPVNWIQRCRRTVDDERLHRQNVSHRRRAVHEQPPIHLRELRFAQFTSVVTPWQDGERAVGCRAIVKVNPQRDQLGQHLGRRLDVNNAGLFAPSGKAYFVDSSRDRHHQVLVARHLPVRGGSLVEIESVDREGLPVQHLSRDPVDAEAGERTRHTSAVPENVAGGVGSGGGWPRLGAWKKQRKQLVKLSRTERLSPKREPSILHLLPEFHGVTGRRSIRARRQSRPSGAGAALSRLR
jgi:hypothetical protein